MPLQVKSVNQPMPEYQTRSSSRLRRALWWLPFGRVAELSAADLHARLQAGQPQLIDVRTVTEYHRSRIAGAMNVPITELRSRLPDLGLDPRQPVIAICLSAHRSVPAVRLLQASGFQQAQQLAGGMLSWWRAGLPTEKG